jgi:hypothetical protein
VVRDGPGDVLASRRNRQLFGEGDWRDRDGRASGGEAGQVLAGDGRASRLVGGSASASAAPSVTPVGRRRLATGLWLRLTAHNHSLSQGSARGMGARSWRRPSRSLSRPRGWGRRSVTVSRVSRSTLCSRAGTIPPSR